MQVPSKETLDDLEAKHKRIAVVQSDLTNDAGEPAWCFVFRKPTQAEYKQGRAKSHDKAQEAGLNEWFFRKLVVWPPTELMESTLDDWPAAPEACIGPILKLSGIAGAERGK